jgi:acetylornithine/succinyldiaminopimelate/putrescine aminotransferase
MPHSRYVPAMASTIATIAALNRVGRPNMTFSGLTVTEECGQVGYLLDGMHPGSDDHVTYFVNSFEEAMSGVVRLVRHSSKVGKCGVPESWILVVDHDGGLAGYFDPAGEGPERALARHVVFVDSVEEAAARLNDQQWSAVVVVAAPGRRCEALFAEVEARPILRVFCQSGEVPSRVDWRVPEADVYVYGENLTGRQVPFGCYVMTQSAYKVWNNPIDAMAQVSTFAASAMVLNLVIATLKQRGFVSAADEAVLQLIDGDRDVRNECYRRFVNPSSGELQEGFGIDYEVESITGMTLRLRDGSTFIDCACGTGANLRGHNPPGLSDEMANHDPSVDYVARLAEFLTERTAFDVVMPAVSGATSVENALMLARLARPDRPKIVTLRGNFSGKTVAALNVSRYGPQRSTTIEGAYEPYCPDVVFVDPFAPDACRQLAKVLSDPQVGLFWAELIQGTTCIPIPGELIDVVATSRARHGFLVGIDEVLTGVWRSSDRLLYHTALLDHVDLTAMAKPLSDGVIPVAVTLARQDVVAAARKQNVNAVRRLQEQYRNNLAAHIAWHALTLVDTPESHKDRREQLVILRSAVERAVSRSKVFAAVEGAASHIRITLNRRYFPFKDGTPMAELIDQMVGEVVMRRTGVILARGRFFPAIFPPPGSMAEVAQRLEVGLPDVTVAAVYRTLITKLAGLTGYFIRRRIGPQFNRVRKLSESGLEVIGNPG